MREKNASVSDKKVLMTFIENIRTYKGHWLCIQDQYVIYRMYNYYEAKRRGFERVKCILRLIVLCRTDWYTYKSSNAVQYLSIQYSISTYKWIKRVSISKKKKKSNVVVMHVRWTYLVSAQLRFVMFLTRFNLV